MKGIGLVIIGLGVLLIIIGILFLFFDKIPFLGQLPGDVRLKGNNSSFYFPITTCIIISIILTILGNILFRLFK